MEEVDEFQNKKQEKSITSNIGALSIQIKFIQI
jgi:hypothetical protein